MDGSPTKDLLLGSFDKWYKLSFGKRPAEELYRITDDPDCVKNLADDPGYFTRKVELREEMQALLETDGDPRALGNEEIFETYRYVGSRKHAFATWLANQ